MTPQEIFVGRLRRHRERNHISLDDIAGDTRIKRELLEAFERNDLSGWPRGLYARAWIRAYASAIGVDAIDAVEEFCRLFPQGDRRVRPTIKQIAAIVASPSEYRDEFTGISDIDRRGSAAGDPARRVPAPHINMMPKPRWRDLIVHVGRLLASRFSAPRSVRQARPQVR
jgi:hypothetical protein